MPGYIERALHRFQHPTPTKPEHSPHPWQKPTFGAKTHFALLPDATAALDAADLTAIGKLATEQSKGTQITMAKLAR